MDVLLLTTEHLPSSKVVSCIIHSSKTTVGNYRPAVRPRRLFSLPKSFKQPSEKYVPRRFTVDTPGEVTCRRRDGGKGKGRDGRTQKGDSDTTIRGFRDRNREGEREEKGTGTEE